MEQEIERPQPPKRPLGVAFLFAIPGLLLLDGAVELFLRGKAGIAAILLFSGLALLLLAVLWATKRI